jgi:hypothetical protein
MSGGNSVNAMRLKEVQNGWATSAGDENKYGKC